MATQKEAMLQIVDSIIDFVSQFQAPTKKHEKAIQKYLNDLAKKKLRLVHQIAVYDAKRKKGQ
jgi:hypothetical protein